jgi:hypothetical protein
MSEAEKTSEEKPIQSIDEWLKDMKGAVILALTKEGNVSIRCAGVDKFQSAYLCQCLGVYVNDTFKVTKDG